MSKRPKNKIRTYSIPVSWPSTDHAAVRRVFSLTRVWYSSAFDFIEVCLINVVVSSEVEMCPRRDHSLSSFRLLSIGRTVELRNKKRLLDWEIPHRQKRLSVFFHDLLLSLSATRLSTLMQILREKNRLPAMGFGPMTLENALNTLRIGTHKAKLGA